MPARHVKVESFIILSAAEAHLGNKPWCMPITVAWNHLDTGHWTMYIRSVMYKHLLLDLLPSDVELLFAVIIFLALRDMFRQRIVLVVQGLKICVELIDGPWQELRWRQVSCVKLYAISSLLTWWSASRDKCVLARHFLAVWSSGYIFCKSWISVRIFAPLDSTDSTCLTNTSFALEACNVHEWIHIWIRKKLVAVMVDSGMMLYPCR